MARGRVWRREIALFAGAYLIYSLARGFSRGSELDALENAARVIALQAQLGLNVEQQVQEFLTGPLMGVLGALYLFAQLVAVPLALVVVYRRRRSAYPYLRTTLLAAWLIAIPIYAVFPTAPPRLAGIGIVDSVTRESIVPLNAPIVEWFYNPVAAVPSLHAAFAVAVGIGLAAALRNPLLRIGALAWGPLVILVVVATGNHFILDVVAGLLVVAVAFSVAVVLHGGLLRRAPAPARAASIPPLDPPGGAPLRVALVCPYAWDAHGGVAAQVREMAESLRERGHLVDVLTPADREIREPGVHVLGPTVGVSHNGSVGRVALSPRASLRALRLVRAGRYDVVHLHEPLVPPCLTVLLLSRRPIVGTFHMYGPDSRLYRVMAPLGRIAVRRLHHRTAVSQAARSCAIGFLGGDYEVIPNGIARDEAAPAARRRDEGGPFRILFVGRNDPRKGLGTLLEAARRLPEVRIDLVGVDHEEVDALLAAGVPPAPARVVAHGRVSDARRRELLGSADVMCAPSLSGESFGLVLVEAMSAGVPVVASEIPGYVDVLAGGGGLMVPPGDAGSLAAALAALAGDPALRRRLADEGRRAAERFEWNRVTPRILDAYARAIAAREARRWLPAPAPAPEAAGAAAARPSPARTSD